MGLSPPEKDPSSRAISTSIWNKKESVILSEGAHGFIVSTEVEGPAVVFSMHRHFSRNSGEYASGSPHEEDVEKVRCT
jgi:hypothetical protein